MTDKTCIIIAGPTAAGKTSLAIRLASHFNTSIISADSRQCFKELNIGVAKPTEEQLKEVHHYFINSHSVTEDVNAVVFENYALEAVNKIFTEHNTAVMAGGTGLYIKAFCEGMDDIPAVNTDVRNSINAAYEQNGITWLQDQVRVLDPLFYASGEIHNPRRLMRALEVVMSTGKPLFTFHQHEKKSRDFRIIKIGVELPREELYNNINIRTDEMIAQGLIEEVRSLASFRTSNALQTVGYKEIFKYLDQECTLNDAIAAVKQNTRHYAKRQMTWFKKDASINWYHPAQFQQITDRITA